MQLPLKRTGLLWVIALRVLVIVTQLRGADRLLRTFFDHGRIADRTFEVWLGGLKYRGRTSHFVDWNILFYGAYEEADLLVLQAFAESTGVRVFADIGANVGQHSLYMAPYCEKVLAFEPNAALYEQLLGNIERNALGNVELQPIALGDSDATVPLFLGSDSGESSLLRNANRNDGIASINVAVKRGDDMFATIGGPLLIKMDVEGFEYSVLRGLKETLRENRPVILLEISEGGRRHFESIDNFIGAFPDGYGFYAWSDQRGLRRDKKLSACGVAQAYAGYGNVYAVPQEKSQLFEKALSIRPNRIRHRRIAHVRIV